MLNSRYKDKDLEHSEKLHCFRKAAAVGSPLGSMTSSTMES